MFPSSYLLCITLLGSSCPGTSSSSLACNQCTLLSTYHGPTMLNLLRRYRFIIICFQPDRSLFGSGRREFFSKGRWTQALNQRSFGHLLTKAQVRIIMIHNLKNSAHSFSYRCSNMLRINQTRYKNRVFGGAQSDILLRRGWKYRTKLNRVPSLQ